MNIYRLFKVFGILSMTMTYCQKAKKPSVQAQQPAQPQTTLQGWPPPYQRPAGRITWEDSSLEKLLYKFAGRWDSATSNTLHNISYRGLTDEFMTSVVSPRSLIRIAAWTNNRRRFKQKDCLYQSFGYPQGAPLQGQWYNGCDLAWWHFRLIRFSFLPDIHIFTESHLR